MLIAKGFSPRFFLSDGSLRRAARGAALLHDETGERWPYASGLVLKIRRDDESCDDEIAQRYFGDDHPLRCGSIAVPPRDLGEWRLVGPVDRAEYRRTGTSYPGEYEHEFKRRKSFFSFIHGRSELPLLYARGDAMRLELGPSCLWSWRGIVSP